VNKEQRHATSDLILGDDSCWEEGEEKKSDLVLLSSANQANQVNDQLQIKWETNNNTIIKVNLEMKGNENSQTFQVGNL